MSNLKAFLKTNKKEKKTTQYPATKSLCDENGNPLMWTVKALSTKEADAIREECTVEVPITGKPGMYRPKVNGNKLLRKLVCAAVVEPDLQNKELQDSYGVMSAEELVVEMIDSPAEFSEFATFVQEYGGIDKTMQEEVDEAKKLINGGDSEAAYAHYCLQKFHWLPSFFVGLSREEKAFVIASIDLRVEEEKRRAKEIQKG